MRQKRINVMGHVFWAFFVAEMRLFVMKRGDIYCYLQHFCHNYYFPRNEK